MILSVQHKFLFIKTVKTAGTAIEVSLSDLCGEEDIFTPINPPVAPHRPRNFQGFRNHMTARAIRYRVGENVWHSLYKITAERNPWDKVVSCYFWQRMARGLDDTFRGYVLKSKVGHNMANPYSLPPALSAYEMDGNPCVDRFIRYETLHDDLDRFCREIIGKPLSQLYEAKRGIRPPSTPYREMYDAETRAAIAHAYEREIDILKYCY